MRRIFPILLASVLLALPFLVSAEIGPPVPGLVTCDGAGGVDAYGAPLRECQVCHVVETGQRIINFFVAIASFLAVVIFAYAGFLMLTAAGETGKISRARGMFTNVLIGLVIVLAGWLIIDTVMKWTFEGSPLDIKAQADWKFGPWNEIRCVILPTSFESSRPAPTPTGWGGPGPGTCTEMSIGPCSPSSLQSSFGDAAGAASRICNAESSGIASSESRSDILRNSGNRPFSIGLFQINLTVHPLSCRTISRGTINLNCPSAFSGRNFDATIINEGLYNQCVELAKNATCNTQKAKEIYTRAGNTWRDWSTASTCGL